MKSQLFKPINFIASLAGTGFIPKAPGTWGSLFSLAIYLILPSSWFELPAHYIFAGAFVIICFFSVWISSLAEKNLGQDAPQIVIDEFCGFFLSVLFLPHTLILGVWAFILFRAFDISKPLFINSAQKLPRGWGVVMDDLAAGLVSNIILQVLVRITPDFFSMI